jgi:predicted aldo/keto reductase-like oxidoreductase
MSAKNKCWSRRDFLKTVGIAGASSLLIPAAHLAEAADATLQVPKRTFGKTGVKVPILSLGSTANIGSNQLMLKQAVQWGVTYWDTAPSYQGGKSEMGFGKYLGKYPQDRQKIFLVTKSSAWTMNGMSKELNTSLKRMKTDYIDLFFVHGISDISEMDKKTKAWAEEKKSQGKIRFFGFSTHSNMEECLSGAAELGWIDGIMMTYNYRLMREDRMKRAVDACVKAGIGLTAMKTQGGGQVKTNTKTELKLAGRFMQKGFTDAQAKLKAVWENPQIACICSRMPNMSILMSNTAAAMDKTKLSSYDRKLLEQYAWETHSSYCAGCTNICESAIENKVPIGDVMRCIMYGRSYGDRDFALAEFKNIPENSRKRLPELDYSSAELKCPHKIPIGKLIKEAVVELT